VEPDIEAIFLDNPMRFSELTFILMVSRIIPIVIASSLPIAERKSEFWISYLITGGYINKREH
jgi:hypothetical protein